ncbi:MAG: hypothetical protein AB1349_13095, partial [Elusimicrobiota bacterium]
VIKVIVLKKFFVNNPVNNSVKSDTGYLYLNLIFYLTSNRESPLATEFHRISLKLKIKICANLC